MALKFSRLIIFVGKHSKGPQDNQEIEEKHPIHFTGVFD